MLDEGVALTARCHAMAEEKGDCHCGLMSREDIDAALAAPLAGFWTDDGGGAAGGGGGAAAPAAAPRAKPKASSRSTRAPSPPPRPAEPEGPPVNRFVAAALARAKAAAAAERRAAGVPDPDAAAAAAAAAPPPREPRTEEDVLALSVRDLKALLDRHGTSYAGIIDKDDLRDVVRDAVGVARREPAVAPVAPRRGSVPDVIAIDDSDDDDAPDDAPAAATAAAAAPSAPPPLDSQTSVSVSAAATAAATRLLDSQHSDNFTARDGNRAWRLSGLADGDDVPPRLPPLPVDGSLAFEDVYDVILLVDNREQFGGRGGGGRGGGGGNRSQVVADEIADLGRCHRVRAEMGHFECGDALWVARRKDGRAAPGEEHVLDIIVERKRLDDLSMSIHDDRYRQQKYYLKRCGLRQVCYLIEGDVRELEATRYAPNGGISETKIKAIKTAAVQTEIYDGFQVIKTLSLRETFNLYGRMTTALSERYAKLTYADSAAAAAERDVDEDAGVVAEDAVPPTLEAFKRALVAQKRSQTTLKTTWGTMLMQVPGLGPEMAGEIIERYPTPSSLRDAYDACDTHAAAAGLLSGIKTSEARSVGPVVSKRVLTSLFGRSEPY